MHIQHSLQKLSSILPIKKALDALQKPTADVYFTVLNGFYQQGRAPLIHELKSSNLKAREQLKILAEHDLLTLDDRGEIRGCYPFSMEQRVHTIGLNGCEVYAMCALDALAPASMFNCLTTISSACAITSRPVRFNLHNTTVTSNDGAPELHVGINWMAATSCGSCADNLCTEMLFLIDVVTAHNWLDEDSENRDIYTLDQAIEFSRKFFNPMLQQSTV